jgi:glutamate carboxypeptidase
MLATRAVIDRGGLDEGRIVMLWTTDEEVGSRTSRALIEAEATKSEAVLVFEPSLPGGALKTSRKGVGQFEMIARGVSAHAGLDPGKGVSAIRELGAADRRHRRSAGSSEWRDADGWRRLGRHARQCGARRSAGDDRRARDHARGADRVQRTMRSLQPHLRGASVEVTGGFDRPPLERTAAVEHLFTQAKSVPLRSARPAGGQRRRRIGR